MPKHSGTQIFQVALDAMGRESDVFSDYARLHRTINEAEVDQATIDLLHGSLERYIHQDRIKILTRLWGGLETGTPQMARAVEVPYERMVKITGVVGFYNFPRTLLFVYIHAHLLGVVRGSTVINELNDLVDELYTD